MRWWGMVPPSDEPMGSSHHSERTDLKVRPYARLAELDLRTDLRNAARYGWVKKSVTARLNSSAFSYGTQRPHWPKISTRTSGMRWSMNRALSKVWTRLSRPQITIVRA